MSTTTTRPVSPPLAAKPQPKPVDASPKKVEPDVALFAASQASRQLIEIVLHDGDRARGYVRNFGQYTVEIGQESGASVVLYKNYIRSVRTSEGPR